MNDPTKIHWLIPSVIGLANNAIMLIKWRPPHQLRETNRCNSNQKSNGTDERFAHGSFRLRRHANCGVEPVVTKPIDVDEAEIGRTRASIQSIQTSN